MSREFLTETSDHTGGNQRRVFTSILLDGSGHGFHMRGAISTNTRSLGYFFPFREGAGADKSHTRGFNYHPRGVDGNLESRRRSRDVIVISVPYYHCESCEETRRYCRSQRRRLYVPMQNSRWMSRRENRSPAARYRACFLRTGL